MNLFSFKKRSFTLIELVIVIVAIVILISIALPQYKKFLERTKVTSAKIKLNLIKKAEHMYFSMHDTYTDDFEELAQEVPELNEKILGDEDWKYTIVYADDKSFLAEAERIGESEYAGYVISINETGKFGGTHPLR